jgi:hypothetical protein
MSCFLVARVQSKRDGILHPSSLLIGLHAGNEDATQPCNEVNPLRDCYLWRLFDPRCKLCNMEGVCCKACNAATRSYAHLRKTIWPAPGRRGEFSPGAGRGENDLGGVILPSRCHCS